MVSVMWREGAVMTGQVLRRTNYWFGIQGSRRNLALKDDKNWDWWRDGFKALELEPGHSPASFRKREVGQSNGSGWPVSGSGKRAETVDSTRLWMLSTWLTYSLGWVVQSHLKLVVQGNDLMSGRFLKEDKSGCRAFRHLLLSLSLDNK